MTDSLASIPHVALLLPLISHAMSVCQHRIHRRACRSIQEAPPSIRSGVSAVYGSSRSFSTIESPLPASHSHRQSWYCLACLFHSSATAVSVASREPLSVIPHPEGAWSRHLHHRVWAELFGPAAGLTKFSQVPLQRPCQSCPHLLSFCVDAYKFSILPTGHLLLVGFFCNRE